MFRKLNIFLSLILISAFVISPAKAASPDYVVLESITAINSTILLGEDLEYELVVSAPKDFAWDPQDSNWDGFLRILLCRGDIFDEVSNPVNCNYQNLQSRYLLTQVSTAIETEEGEKTLYTFSVFGKPVNYSAGEYFVFLVRLPNGSMSDTDLTQLYYLNKQYATDIFGSNLEIIVPSFESTNISVVTQLPQENNQEEVQEPEPEIEEVIPEEPPVVVVPPPAPPAGRSQGGGAQPVLPVAVNELLEQEVLALPLSGNQEWKPMRGIKGKFENWKVGRKNSINGVNPLFTRTNLSMMTFRTTGDSVSLRYLGGKKRGSFSIYVNGEFVERIDAKTKKKRKLVKTWEGLGEGRHFVDIVAELDQGESIAINGVQRPRLN